MEIIKKLLNQLSLPARMAYKWLGLAKLLLAYFSYGDKGNLDNDTRNLKKLHSKRI